MDEKPFKPFFVLKGFLFVFFVLTGFFVAGYYITTKIYEFTGEPSKVLSVIISGFAGALLFTFFVWVMSIIRMRNFKHSDRKFMYTQMLEALSEIAQGNFGVSLNLDDNEPHHEMAKAINAMAKNLGNLESMRQNFISDVSHEIQSPLTSISGFAALLKDNNISPEKRLHYAEIIESESRRLSSMSEKLLNLSTLENGVEPLVRKEYRLDKQLENITLTLEPQWRAKKLSVEAELEKTIFSGDEGLLSQVWINLLNNAIKFTPEGGKILLSLKKEDNIIFFQISDMGVGLSPEEQLHVFERFYKADKSRDRALGGNGLGLALVKKIIDLHGGSVSVKSELGSGSIFIVKLK